METLKFYWFKIKAILMDTFTLAIIIGATFIILSFYPLINFEHWSTLFFSIGQLIIVSGAFSFVAKSDIFHGLFQGLLHDILFGEKFLKNLVDVKPTWMRVSKVLVSNELGEIPNDLLKGIVDHYFVTKNKYWVDDYFYDIKVTEFDGEYICYEENISMKIYPYNNTDNVFNASSIIPRNKGDNIYCYIDPFKLDRKVVDISKYTDEDDETDDKNFIFKMEYPLEDNKEKFRIEYTRHKKIKFAENKFKYFLASTFMKGFKAKITYPDDKLNANFIPLGTIDQFKDDEQTHSVGKFEIDTNDVILPKQGIGIFWESV